MTGKGFRKVIITAELVGELLIELLQRDLRDRWEPKDLRIVGKALPLDVYVESFRYYGTTHRVEILLGSKHWRGTRPLDLRLDRRFEKERNRNVRRLRLTAYQAEGGTKA